MISNNVKRAFKVEKLHPIPRIRELATHGSHGIQEKRKQWILIKNGAIRISNESNPLSLTLLWPFISFAPCITSNCSRYLVIHALTALTP